MKWCFFLSIYRQKRDVYMYVHVYMYVCRPVRFEPCCRQGECDPKRVTNHTLPKMECETCTRATRRSIVVFRLEACHLGVRLSDFRCCVLPCDARHDEVASHPVLVRDAKVEERIKERVAEKVWLE